MNTFIALSPYLFAMLSALAAFVWHQLPARTRSRLRTIEDFASKVVTYVEQSGNALDNPTKLHTAEVALTHLLDAAHLHVSEQAITIFIEAAVAEMKAAQK